MTDRARRPTIAVIGAGFSGSLVALHLLAAGAAAPRILLVERARGFGKGVAYSTRHGAHLLNVRAGNMSAFPDRSGHFLDWLRNRNEVADPAGFVARATYGQYLQEMLSQAAMGSDAVGRLVLVADDAVSLTRVPDGGFRLTTDVGRSYAVDGAVLAMGNFPPDPPPGVDKELLGSFRFQTDPWAPKALSRIGKTEPVLLLGTSLTMVDVALSLTDQGHEGPILALSRRGLLPRRHGPAAPPTVPQVPPPIGPSLAASLRSVRAAVRAAGEEDRSWHFVIDSLRGGTAAFWHALPVAVRARFLRHLRPWWDVHRHRLAPPVDERLRAMMAAGRLRVVAGRLERLSEGKADDLCLRLRPRGQDHAEELSVRHAINCVGPGGDIAGTRDPLLRGLLDAGLVRPDPLRLGLDTDAGARLVDREGIAVPGLYAMGPIMRGAQWEITAVPDIRVQAQKLAGAIMGETMAGAGI
ncbi:FAD/NAD(P)-binding protein [Niveispirillum sp. KHB5.9]|uniref:FAD/NAD(P)-binding protein n=1 Tax=Niveispirillum sp. KHB5.9 TaxID=3400269 RepID=UPI003A863836